MPERARGVDQRALFKPDQLRAGCGGNKPDVVGGDDDRRPQPVHRRQQVQDALGHGGIDIARRLVGNDQLGAGNHGTSDGHPLLLAAGQRRRSGAGAVGESNPRQHLAYRSLGFLLASACDPQRKRDIIERGEVTDQAKVLEYHADPAPIRRHRVPRSLAQFLAKQGHSPARRALSEVKQLQERGLACTGRAGQEIKAALVQPEVKVAQHLGTCAVA